MHSESPYMAMQIDYSQCDFFLIFFLIWLDIRLIYKPIYRGNTELKDKESK
jgi:hypothetical protein